MSTQLRLTAGLSQTGCRHVSAQFTCRRRRSTLRSAASADLANIFGRHHISLCVWRGVHLLSSPHRLRVSQSKRRCRRGRIGTLGADIAGHRTGSPLVGHRGRGGGRPSGDGLSGHVDFRVCLVDRSDVHGDVSAGVPPTPSGLAVHRRSHRGVRRRGRRRTRTPCGRQHLSHHRCRHHRCRGIVRSAHARDVHRGVHRSADRPVESCRVGDRDGRPDGAFRGGSGLGNCCCL